MALKQKILGDSLTYVITMSFNFVSLLLGLSLLWRSMGPVSTREYPIIQLICGASVVLFDLGFSSAVLRFQKDFPSIIHKITRLWLFLAALLFPMIVLVSKYTVAQDSLTYWVLLAVFHGSTFAFFQITASVVRAERRLYTYGIISCSKNLIILSSFFGLYLSDRLGIASWLATQGVVHGIAGILLLWFGKQSHPKKEILTTKVLLKYTFPIWATALVGFSEGFIDIVFLKYRYPDHLVDYRIAMEYGIFLTALIQLLKLAWPVLAYEGLADEGKNLIHRIIPKSILTLGFYTLALIILIGPALNLYIGNEPSAEAKLFGAIQLFSINYAFFFVVIRPVWEFKKNIKQLFIATVLAMILNFLGNFLFVHNFGGTAAALSSAISNLAAFWYLYIQLKPKLKSLLYCLILQIIFILTSGFIFKLTYL